MLDMPTANRVQVYSTPDVDVENQGQYAADLTSKCFRLFEESFEIEYPLPKIDCIALADKQGAMEVGADSL